MLEQRDRRRRPGRDRVGGVPDLVLVEHPAVLHRFRSGGCAGDDAILTVHAEADQRPDDRAELLRLLGTEVAGVEDVDARVFVLPDDRGIDHADDVRVLQPLQLLEDLALELGIFEAEDEHLHWSDRHLAPPHIPCRIFCFWTSNSASVSTPCVWRSASCFSFSMLSSVIPPAAGAAAACGAGCAC